MREGERERRAGNNHHRHRPSAAIIRRHARLLRARYVDLLQKTLLPSFLLARSRHALFSAPPLRPDSPPAVPPSSPSHVYTIFPPLDAIRAPLNARMHACSHTSASRRACISREKRSNAPLCVQTRMRIRLEPRRWTTPSRFLSLALFSPFPHFCLLSSCPLAASPWLTLLECARCVMFVCVSGIHYH